MGIIAFYFHDYDFKNGRNTNLSKYQSDVCGFGHNINQRIKYNKRTGDARCYRCKPGPHFELVDQIAPLRSRRKKNKRAEEEATLMSVHAAFAMHKVALDIEL